ncbi:MAG: bifunctional 3-(3-hydroxy-phenyl)propionate/3-hydroxycinnamic acid hydroxylase [Ilumatobacter sp.]|nr:bifunctional 3-(3-hydroxy-phenyl)propionate/3-hydroxycinnamic acid hydroxylase [Ilumatobacter sp.]
MTDDTTRDVDADVDADVAIVGLGPTGLVLAILLAQRGHRVVAFERWPEPYPLPRAVHFDHEVGRILQACGIGDELRTIIEPAGIYEWRNAAGATLLRFGRDGDAASGWPASSMFSQPDLERLLSDRLASLDGVDVRRGVEIVALEQRDGRVDLVTADDRRVGAMYVVGCDGARSTVRDLVGIEMTDHGFFYDWLIVDVELHEPRVFEPTNLQVCDPARPTTAVSGGPGRRRWEFMRLPDEPVDELHREERAWELLAPWDIRPDNCTLVRHAVYTFAARHASEWRAGSVFLAGDAAHQMPPFAGQGMCAGVRDAANLSWKLDHVLRGVADDAVLDTYAVERSPSARSAIDFSMELGKVICVPDADEAAARDEAMIAGVTDEPAPAPDLPGIDDGFIDDSPDAGALFVQGTIGGRPADDVLGVGWRIVSPFPVVLDDDLADWFASIDGVVSVVDPAAPDDPNTRRWFDSHGRHAVLQRPDFHVYGTAATDVELARLLVRLRAALTREVSP